MLDTAPGDCGSPAGLPSSATWRTASAPGTVAAALRDAGSFDPLQPPVLDDRDWWYRAQPSASGAHRLCFEGLATLAEVWLDERQILQSTNMYHRHEVETVLHGAEWLHLCFRALSPAFAAPAKRARWRTFAATPGTLRLFRTTWIGRMNGWCPPVRAIGPWRPICLTRLDEPADFRDVKMTSSCEGSRGHLVVRLRVANLGGRSLQLKCGDQTAEMTGEGDDLYSAELTIENVRRWAPHTHGEPHLYAVQAMLDGTPHALGQTGFRDICVDRGADGEGFGLRVNGVDIFCRGACWTNADIVALPQGREAFEPLLRRMRDAGMNMVRVGATMLYEANAFYEVCDELGLLVWQDFMLSNFDYPTTDAAFCLSVEREAREFLTRTSKSPCIALLCGASEVAQQAAMMGLPESAWTNSLIDVRLAKIAADVRPDAIYIAQTPFGGALPFMPGQGVCHYYGVSAYMRPLEDARRSGVRFAAECLGFANVPDEAAPLETRAAVVQPNWGEKRDRDVGAIWYFEDVRNHYLRELYDVDPQALRAEDAERYLELSRAVNAELMEGVFGLWRRAGSPTRGGLVWFLRDVTPGAGWGVLASNGEPKSVWYALRRAFRSVQIVLVDEGLNGLDAHLINETAEALDVTVRFACLRDGQTPVASGERKLQLAPRSAVKTSCAELLGAFFDTNYVYRFGPPSHDINVAQAFDADGESLCEAFHFPLGRGHERHDTGLRASLERDASGFYLRLECVRLTQSVHIEDTAFRPDDNWFHLAPGRARLVRLSPRWSDSAPPQGAVRAINSSEVARYGAAS